ncbi:type I-E CRISPR-associated protein Cas5/CasD [Tomitella fengzijianii]|uniref:Type I-E CRISPR-associated protein Cas5/CasD n=1 Tax=Tomitella fengzijianii TaxID=2597660 RepID=A0A516X670_9ACTN|nr:type I-E CRISPR-associated protein Cas5/CasD [Tomitella fengzijianii]QDQ98568.1 type I-E CRISPR-associated protein Cas5/CasD [Tomitella fengzijianii]
MTTLVIPLRGPMQAWGGSSRFSRRETGPVPTKSGIVGLLGAALGRRRTDPIEDLAQLRFGVRTDQQGSLERDFQTAKPHGEPHSKLSYRFYLADALFLAAVEGPDEVIGGLAGALQNPKFPLFLGRRSYPPAGPIRGEVVDTPMPELLRTHPWHAAEWYRRRQSRQVSLPIVRDPLPEEDKHEVVRDLPFSFDPRHREYGWREVHHERTDQFDNPLGRRAVHDPLALLGGA